MNQQRCRMIVLSERLQSVEDLVKEIFGSKLLQNFVIDPGTNFANALQVDSLQDFTHRGSEGGQGFAVIPVEPGPQTAHRQDSPHSSASTQPSQRYVPRNGIFAPPNKGGQELS